MLVVRPFDPAFPKKRYDVNAVVGSDVVRFGGGGLSVFSDRAAILLQAVDLFLFEIETADFPSGLIEVPAGKPHYHIEPQSDMTLDDFQNLLAATRDSWKRV